MLITAPPMPLGESLDGKDADGNLQHEDKLGMIHTFAAYPQTGGPNRNKAPFTGRPITAVLLRNTSGLTMLGKRLVQIDRTAGYATTKNFDGYSSTLANRGVALLDPYLPTAGVVDDDIAWCIVGGPAPVLLPLVASDHTADIAVGSELVAATGTTTAVTTSGRITHVRFTNATAGETGAGFNAYNMAAGLLGRAMSARTSQETTAGADLLVDWCIRVFGR